VYPDSASAALTHERAADYRRGAARGSEKFVADALADSPLFSQCSKRELRLVAKTAKVKAVPAGTVLVKQDEPGEAMFVILSGSASVQRGGRKLAALGAGDVVGELALLSRGPRNATVTTTTAADIATIERRGLNRLVEDAPGFARKLLEAMADRIREIDKKIVC
jgi:CRP/FNR family transcriptional regulator, cyclic AMP receptor protein